MDWGLIVYLVVALLGALLSAIPSVAKWNKARNAKNKAEEDLKNAVSEADIATAEAEKEKAMNEMLAHANAFIQNAEITFSAFDKVMKAQGNGTAGALKKENVLTRLQAFALSMGYEFDHAFWSEKIDEIVAFTKKVNSKN